MKIICCFTIIIVSIMGCANSQLPRLATVNTKFDARIVDFNSTKCCANLRETKAIEITGEHGFSMEENNDLLKVGDITTRYNIFDIKQVPSMQYYRLRSYIIGDKGERHVFVPTVGILDENFNFIGMSHPGYIGYQPDHFIYEDAHLWMYFSVNIERQPRAKYILVFSGHENGSEFGVDVAGSRSVNSYTVHGGSPVVYSEYSAAYTVKSRIAPSGALSIKNIGFWNIPFDKSLIQKLY